MKIILATNNKHKISEIRKILNIKGLEILSLLDFPQKIKVAENGKTFKENAIKKASAAAKKFGATAIADDSGLCVNALNGLPGVKSARFVKPPVTSERLCAKLLKAMKKVPPSERGAYFVCSVAICYPKKGMAGANGRSLLLAEEICRGRIISEMKGSSGFGYDPVFIPEGRKKTFAQMSGSRKNKISHRGKAFRKAGRELLNLF